MVNYKYIILGFLAFMIASSIVYVQLSNDVKFRIDEDKTTLYIKDLNDAGEPVGSWKVAGREYSKIMDGSSNTNRDTKNIYIETAYKDENGSLTILRDNKEVTESEWIAQYNQLKPNQFSAIRVTPYIRGHTVIDTYLFDGTLDDVELVPLKHLVTVLNGEGLFLRYYIEDIYEPAEKEKLNGDTSTVFGRLKVEFQEGYNWAWIGWPYGKDSFAVQYKIESNDESFELRLFDPIIEPSPRENDYTAIWKFDESILGSNLIKNGDFSDGSADWIRNGAWTISDGEAHYNNTGASTTLQQNLVYEAQTTYEITFTVTEISTGGFRIYCGGYGALRTAPGTYTEVRNSNADTTFYLLGAAADGSIDNIIVKRLMVDDVSGNGKSLTAVNSVSFETDQNGKENGATIFDGETPYFRLDNSDEFVNMKTDDLTINFWAKIDTTDDQMIFRADGYYMQVFGGVMKAYFNATEKSQVMDVDVGNWAMYSFVYDRDGDLSLYRNAEFQRAIDISSGDGFNFSSGYTPIYLFSLTEAGRFFNGSVSELGVIRKALSQEELEADYKVGNNKIIQYNSPRDSDYDALWELNVDSMNKTGASKDTDMLSGYDFTSGWTTYHATVTSSSSFKADGTSASNSIYKAGIATVGHTYLIRLKGTLTGSSLDVKFVSESNRVTIPEGKFNTFAVIEADSTSLELLMSSLTSTCTLDIFEMYDVDSIDFLDSSYSYDKSVNLMQNSGFDTDTWWTVGASGNITGGVLEIDTGAASYAIESPDNYVAPGDLYYYEFDVTNYVSGTGRLYIGLGYAQDFSANGHYSGYYTATGTGHTIIYTKVGGLVCDLDNLEVRRAPGYTTGIVDNAAGFLTDQNGKENGAVDFTGRNYVMTSYGMSRKETFSTSLWMKSSTTATNYGLLGSANYRLIQMGSTGNLRLYSYNETDATQVFNEAPSIADGEWHYIVVNKYEDYWEYYLDAELIITVTDKIAGPLSYSQSDNVNIGYPSSDYAKFIGSISEVGIMDRPMTEEEILAKYKVGRNKQIIYSPASNGLVFQAHTTSQYFDGDRFIAPGPFEINTYDVDESVVRQNGTEMNGSIFTRIIEVPDTTGSVIDMTDELTIEAVVYLRDRIPYNCLITKGDNFAYNQQNYGICFEGTQTQLIINKFVYSDAYDFPLNEWLDVVMTWDGTNIKLYVNGDLKITKAHSGTITPDNAKLRLGSFYNQEDIDGIFKVGRVYNRALTTNEIEHNYEVEKQWWT